VSRYATRLELRDLVNAKLEEQRQTKTIGTSLEAEVRLAGTGRFAEALAGWSADDLAAFCIVSKATVIGADPTQAEDSLVVTVSRSEGAKCQRCWRYVSAVSDAPETEGLCDRCADALGLGGRAA
jgi:isoleucyl-tRNA synthetase